MIPGWKDELQKEYLDFLRKQGTVSPSEMAAHLNISECCAVFWLTDMARSGKVRIRAVELVEKGDFPCDPQTALTCQRKALCPALAET
jgi:hypothetical protein